MPEHHTQQPANPGLNAALGQRRSTKRRRAVMGRPVSSLPSVEPKLWCVYLLWSESSGRSYVGIALDPAQRLRQHNGELPGGARSTRAGRPWTIVRVVRDLPGRGPAQAVEAAWKRVRGRARLRWQPPDEKGPHHP